jgi:hypothetical protein
MANTHTEFSNEKTDFIFFRSTSSTIFCSEQLAGKIMKTSIIQAVLRATPVSLTLITKFAGSPVCSRRGGIAIFLFSFFDCERSLQFWRAALRRTMLQSMKATTLPLCCIS